MYNYEPFPDRSEEMSQNLLDRDTLCISDTNLQKIFHIIDTLVSLECCVYYQIIPLSVIDNCLNLGMVNPEDISAINYIISTIAYLKYGLNSQPIDAETHEVILSAYLKYRQAKEERKKEGELSIDSSSAGDFFAATPLNSFSNNKNISALEDGNVNDSDKPTFIIDLKMFSPSEAIAINSAETSSKEPFSEVQKLEIPDNISPQQLSKKLLSKILQGEIGRLYFERQKNYGKIICSQEGKIQYSLDRLSLAIFQGMIDEFKILVNLPLTNKESVCKVEVERNYKQDRVLLRLQVLKSSKGEEGTLQVLRGKALKFYKQNKVEQLGKQALDLAQKLERKLYQINTYSSDLQSGDDKFVSRALSTESLVALQTIIQTLSQYSDISVAKSTKGE